MSLAAYALVNAGCDFGYVHRTAADPAAIEQAYLVTVDGTLGANGVGADGADTHLHRAFLGVGHGAEPVGHFVHDFKAQ